MGYPLLGAFAFMWNDRVRDLQHLGCREEQLFRLRGRMADADYLSTHHFGVFQHPTTYFFGFHSRASFSASAICAGVI
jgi:hypothetical protein